jgi:amino acid permease
VALCTCTYIFFGICGYFTFYEEVQGNILLNYSQEENNDIFVEIGRLDLAFIVSFSIGFG